jgi:peptide deformylase
MTEHIIGEPKRSVGSLLAASALLGAPISLRTDNIRIQGEPNAAPDEPVAPPSTPIKPPAWRGIGPSRLTLWGDPLLETMQNPVSDFGPELQELVANLFGRLGGLHGYGLAAPQIGVNKRVAVIGMRQNSSSGSKKPGKPVKIVMCNPFITKKGQKVKVMEGCLSIPGFFHTIERRHSVTVSYEDENGKRQTLNAKGLLAQVIQHEVDHLDGIIMTSYVHERQAKRRAQRLVDDARKKG